MTHVVPLLAVVVASLLWRAAAAASVLCAWTDVLRGDEQQLSFVRQDSSSARLYHSVWSGERALLSCAWSDDAAVLHGHASLCRERARDFPAGTFNASLISKAEDQCVRAPAPGSAAGARTGKRPVRSVDGQENQGQDERSEVKSHRRVKRGFIVPGTLWCGSGNKAPSYEDLGVFADTDGCCREHDQCKHTILSFHSRFGIFNTNIFTMSHCECDDKFRRCLMGANDSIAHAVGYTFFNLLKMHCFQFSHRLQCTQRNWFGLCKESKMALYAEVHPPTLFEVTEVSTNSTGSIGNTTTPAELQGSGASGPPFFFVSVPTPVTSSPSDSVITNASTVPTPVTGSPSGSTFVIANASRVPTPATSSPSGSFSAVASVTPSTVLGRTDLENTVPTNLRPQEQAADFTAKLLACGVYRDLDKCRSKIPPHGNRFGLHNPEPRTLYHCNCTTRLFQAAAAQTRLTEVQALLLEHVSRSCFLPQDCTAGAACAAVLLKAEFPPVAAEAQRHLQAASPKVRGPNANRGRRKDGAGRLHRRCLRVVGRNLKQRSKRPV